MKKIPDKADSITIGDRIASAVVSAIATSLTLVVYYIFLFANAGKISKPPAAMFDSLIFKMLLSLIVFTGLAGFFLGSSRMADALGYLWGTSDDVLEQRWFKTLLVFLGVLLLGWAVILWRHFSGI